MDLKDKWRNLERQGVVGPADSGPAALPGGAQQGQHPDGSVMPQDGQQALDVQVDHPALSRLLFHSASKSSSSTISYVGLHAVVMLF